jgi:DNA modification methylase
MINKIICGDSVNVLKEIQSNSIDMIITSPPYNFSQNYDGYNDDKPFYEYYENFLFPILSECVRVLKVGGRMAINIQPLFSEYVPTHHDITSYLRNAGLLWKGEILWEKNNYNCKVCSWGSWKSPSSPYLKYTWEFVEVFCKGNYKKEGSRENIDITADEFKSWVVAKWSIAPERHMKDFGHPAMFPEELVYRLIKLFSYKGDIILDPFNGVGTTTLVASKLDRKFIGIDISKQYCDVAVKRLSDKEGE